VRPSAVALLADPADRVAAYQAAMAAAGRRTGRSTMQAARTFSAKLERAGGWEQMSRARQLDAIGKARSFASWMMVTGQLTIDADVLGRVCLRLGTSARTFCPMHTPGS
jgi:integrase/recombinase XerD